MKKILIKNGIVVFEKETKKVDLLIEKGKIKKIGNLEPEEDTETIKAKNRYVLPGAIDVHTHMELEVWKGMISSDDYYNGSLSGLKGGVTFYFGFAYPAKKESIWQAYKRELKKASEKSVTPFKLHTAINRIYRNLEQDLIKCKKNGSTTFKLHLNDPQQDTIFLYEVYSLFKKHKVFPVIHCEDGKLIEYLKAKYAKEKKLNVKYHPRTRENFTERMAIEQVLNYVRFFKVKTYIMHLSTREGLDAIEKAKEENLPVYVETCPHYLLFTEKMYLKKDGYLYTCTPPFRTKKDNKALWNGLKKGIIDVVSTDHCPFLRKQKDNGKNNFLKIPYGLAGIETLYPVMLSEARKRGFKIEDVVRWVALNPAKIFNLYPEYGVIKKGIKASLVIYNPEKKYKISYKELQTNCDYSIYEGMTLKGKIEKVILGDTII